MSVVLVFYMALESEINFKQQHKQHYKKSNIVIRIYLLNISQYEYEYEYVYE